MKLKRQILNALDRMAVTQAVIRAPEMQRMWDLSMQVLPDLTDHYATVTVDREAQLRLRLLLCAQALFMHRVYAALIAQGQAVTSWVDVGDSDGAARQLFMRCFPEAAGVQTLGVNLEQEAVDMIRRKGLAAECMNAMDLHRRGYGCDLVSVFETLEHMPNPLGFLESMHQVVGTRLIISVPLIIASRVGLLYQTAKWEAHKEPRYSNNHVFELSPDDWTKLFRHTGWSIDDEWSVRQYPEKGLLKQLMQYTWRKIGFEGYWFISLREDTTFSSRFVK